MGFPRQEYWCGMLFPSPGDFPKPGTKPASPALAGRFFTPEPPGELVEQTRLKSNLTATKTYYKAIASSALELLIHSQNQPKQQKYIVR